ncbi:MAG: acylneuraminate cytidylyltransferase family protein [Rhodospirillales bacterium]
MTQHRLVALMPMRHHSQRVPGKNYRPFGDGRPLYQHALESLLSVAEIEKVVIDTDSPVVKEQCAEKYKDVIVLDRPEHLRAPEIPMNDILTYDATEVPSDFYLQTHSTNPLLSHATMAKAVTTFFAQYPIYDSLFGVTVIRDRIWDVLGRAVNHNPNILLQTQDLPKWLVQENSTLYIFERGRLLNDRNRIGNRPFLFEVDEIEARDIDIEIDFQIAEMLFQARKGEANG